MTFSECLSNSVSHTVQILFNPPRVVFWVLMVLLVYMMSGFNPYGSILQSAGIDTADPQWMAELMEDIESKLFLIVSLVLLGLLFGIIQAFLAAACLFLLYQGVKAGVVRLVADFFQHVGSIVSLFLWNIVITLLVFIAVALLFGVFMAIAALLGMEPTTGFIFLGCGCIFGIIFFISAILYSMIMGTLVIPQMLVEKRGIFSAWGTALSLFTKNLIEMMGVLVVGIVVIVIVGVISVIIMMGGSLFLMALGLAASGGEISPEAFTRTSNSIFMMPFAMLSSVFTLPFMAFSCSFALHIMAKFTENPAYIPERSPALDTFGSDDDTPDAPESPDGGTPPVTPPPTTSGPVSFSDIPQDTAPPQSPNPDNPPLNPHSPEGSRDDSDPPKPPQSF